MRGGTATEMQYSRHTMRLGGSTETTYFSSTEFHGNLCTTL